MKIILLMTAWCPDCHRAVEWLNKNKIVYEAINIEDNPEWAKKLEEKTGKRGVPYFIIDDEWVQGYEPGKSFQPSLIKKYL